MFVSKENKTSRSFTQHTDPQTLFKGKPALLQRRSPSFERVCKSAQPRERREPRIRRGSRGAYLASRQHVSHGFAAEVGRGNHILLPAGIPGCHSFGRCHGDAFRHPDGFFWGAGLLGNILGLEHLETRRRLNAKKPREVLVGGKDYSVRPCWRKQAPSWQGEN